MAAVSGAPPVPHGPFERPVPWKWWWLVLWGANTIGNLGWLALWHPEWWRWCAVALPCFFGMEIFGLIEAKSGYPPLTDCIREYVPEWLAFALLFFFVGLGGGTWFQVCPRYGLAVLVGFLGWLTAHFSVTFNQPKAFQETVKYAWWAKKFGGPGQRVSRWLLGRRATTAEEVWPLEAANRRGATGTTEPGPKEPDVP